MLSLGGPVLAMAACFVFAQQDTAYYKNVYSGWRVPISGRGIAAAHGLS